MRYLRVVVDGLVHGEDAGAMSRALVEDWLARRLRLAAAGRGTRVVKFPAERVPECAGLAALADHLHLAPAAQIALSERLDRRALRRVRAGSAPHEHRRRREKHEAVGAVERARGCHDLHGARVQLVRALDLVQRHVA